MNIKFRQTTKEDLAAIGGILKPYIEKTTNNFHFKPLNKAALKKILLPAAERYKTFSIVFDEKIIGFTIVMQYKNRAAYDRSCEVAVYLTEEFCGRGIGKQALAFIEKQAGEAQFHCLIATICGDNIPSIRLFEKAGYEKCGHFKEVGYKFNRYLDVIAYQKIL